MKRLSHRRLFLLLLILLYGLLVSRLRSRLQLRLHRRGVPDHDGAGDPRRRAVPRMSAPHRLGDDLAGARGARRTRSAAFTPSRILNVLIGLALTVIVYATAAMLFGGTLGLIAAALFMCTGQTLYLMKLGTYDMIAAFFLGASFFMFVVSATRRAAVAPEPRDRLRRGGAVSRRHHEVPPPRVRAGARAVRSLQARNQADRALLRPPLAVLGALYLGFDQYAPRLQVLGQVETYANIKVPLATMFEWAFRWVAFVLLLAVFGVFHERHGKTAIVLIALSLADHHSPSRDARGAVGEQEHDLRAHLSRARRGARRGAPGEDILVRRRRAGSSAAFSPSRSSSSSGRTGSSTCAGSSGSIPT